MKKNLLLIGSETEVAQAYIENFSQEYEHVVGIDDAQFSSLKLFKSLDVRNSASTQELMSFLEKLDLTFTHILFSYDFQETKRLFEVDTEELCEDFYSNFLLMLSLLQDMYSFFSDTASIVIVSNQMKSFPRQQNFHFEFIKNAIDFCVGKLSREFRVYFEKDIRINSISLKVKTYQSVLSLPNSKTITIESAVYLLEFLFGEKGRAIRGQILDLD